MYIYIIRIYIIKKVYAQLTSKLVIRKGPATVWSAIQLD